MSLVPTRGLSKKRGREADCVNGELQEKLCQKKATWTGEPFSPGEWQLFDLSVDLGESNDLSAQNPKLKQRLIEAWDEYARLVGVIPPQTQDVIHVTDGVGVLFGNKAVGTAALITTSDIRDTILF